MKQSTKFYSLVQEEIAKINKNQIKAEAQIKTTKRAILKEQLKSDVQYYSSLWNTLYFIVSEHYSDEGTFLMGDEVFHIYAKDWANKLTEELMRAYKANDTSAQASRLRALELLKECVEFSNRVTWALKFLNHS